MNAGASSLDRLVHLYRGFARVLSRLSPLLDLALRVVVAQVFWMSGLTKIRDWSSTVALFTNEFHVPLLPPSLAALLGTAIELSMPVLLLLGLGTRFAASVLFVFNIVAVISYPGLSDLGRQNHLWWGTMLLVTLLHGPGPISIDRLLERRLGCRPAA